MVGFGRLTGVRQSYLLHWGTWCGLNPRIELLGYRREVPAGPNGAGMERGQRGLNRFLRI
jgi:hypothetical protein